MLKYKSKLACLHCVYTLRHIKHYNIDTALCLVVCVIKFEGTFGDVLNVIPDLQRLDFGNVLNFELVLKRLMIVDKYFICVDHKLNEEHSA